MLAHYKIAFFEITPICQSIGVLNHLHCSLTLTIFVGNAMRTEMVEKLSQDSTLNVLIEARRLASSPITSNIQDLHAMADALSTCS